LAEAGYPDGLDFPKVGMFTSKWIGKPHMAQYLQAQWRENLGVNVMLTVADTYQEFIERTVNAQFPVFVAGWLADYPDADNFLRVAVALRSPWRSQDFDDLIGAASRVGDQAERVKLYQAAKSAGMQCIAVPNHSVAQLDLSQADRVATSLHEVRATLPELTLDE